jgi:hypothetical protein
MEDLNYFIRIFKQAQSNKERQQIKRNAIRILTVEDSVRFIDVYLDYLTER